MCRASNKKKKRSALLVDYAKNKASIRRRRESKKRLLGETESCSAHTTTGVQRQHVRAGVDGFQPLGYMGVAAKQQQSVHWLGLNKLEEVDALLELGEIHVKVQRRRKSSIPEPIKFRVRMSAIGAKDSKDLEKCINDHVRCSVRASLPSASSCDVSRNNETSMATVMRRRGRSPSGRDHSATLRGSTASRRPLLVDSERLNPSRTCTGGKSKRRNAQPLGKALALLDQRHPKKDNLGARPNILLSHSSTHSLRSYVSEATKNDSLSKSNSSFSSISRSSHRGSTRKGRGRKTPKRSQSLDPSLAAPQWTTMKDSSTGNSSVSNFLAGSRIRRRALSPIRDATVALVAKSA